MYYYVVITIIIITIVIIINNSNKVLLRSIKHLNPAYGEIRAHSQSSPFLNYTTQEVSWHTGEQ